MEPISGVPQQIIEALERDWIVLTANQRAARTLRRAFDLLQHARGKLYWDPPSILAWDSWLEDQWNRLLIDGHVSDLLLNSAQEQTLWRSIIAADHSAASLLPDALAETAGDAWLRLHRFRARKLLQSYHGNADTRSFARWAAEFDRRCTRAHYVTEAQLPEAIRTAIEAGLLDSRSSILLVGFDSITPAQTGLLDSLRATGLEIQELATTEAAAKLTLAASSDEYSELTACARWIRTRLAGQPKSSIAVVLPGMETCRTEIDRVFRHILAPELDDIAAPASTGPYEFSLGVPLAEMPLVATALDVLRWSVSPLPLDGISSLLLSRYFSSASAESELLARAEFDAFVLRSQHLLQPMLTIQDLHRLLGDSRFNGGLPGLRDQVRAMHSHLTTTDFARARRSHAEWAALFSDTLEAAGWASLAQLDSIEFQTLRKWESALDEFTTLDFEGARLSFSDALTALERIAAKSLFAPESRHAPVQIMGPLEASGSNFDAIWFLRASDLSWPARPSSNPLLPWPLQRELAMPGVNPEIDSALGRRITARIAGSAPTVIFSYARQSAEGHQRASSALADLFAVERALLDMVPEQPQVPAIALDSFADAAFIPPPPDIVLQGGAGVLQSQAACGFRAFAEKRLFSAALEPVSLGLDPSERGSLVHSVLEHFWGEVKTQAALKLMPRDSRVAQLNQSIDIAFAEHYARPDAGWSRAYIDSERQRLLDLLLDWLQFEESRSPFTVKQREEELTGVSIGPLKLDIRVDRIDTHLSGDQPSGEIIVDYKTGAAAPKDWLGPRPDAPQLPLYAVVANRPHLAAIAFASVRPGNLMGMAGYENGSAGQKSVLPKPTRLNAASLSAQVDEWRAVLTTLAEEFHSGNAAVSPKQYPRTCQYCEQRLLCRLNPSALEPDILEELEDDDSVATEENDFA